MSMDVSVDAKPKKKNAEIRSMKGAAAQRPYIHIVFLIVAVALLIPRLDGFGYYSGKYLLSEDGPIFMQQAQESGLFSLLIPYNGYLHLYPRIISLIASHWDFIYRPPIMLIGWLLAYIFMFYQVIRGVEYAGAGRFAALIVVVLTALQSNNGMVFFALVNSQWFLGAGFCFLIMIMAEESSSISIARIPLLIVLGLTGPFSIVLAPVYILRSMHLRNFKLNSTAFILLGCAVIQASFILYSGRTSDQNVDPQILHWVIPFFRTLAFGAQGLLAIATTIAVWAVVIVALAIGLRSGGAQRNKIAEYALWSLLIAVLFILSSEYSHKLFPAFWVGRPGVGDRYSWIPYSMLIFSVIILLDRYRSIQIVIALLMGFGFLYFLHPIRREKPSFLSYVNFSRYRRIAIPIGRTRSGYSPWLVFAGPSWHDRREAVHKVNLNPSRFSTSEGKLKISNGIMAFKSESKGSKIIYSKPIICHNTAGVGVLVDLWRSSRGTAELFWSHSSNFSHSHSMKLWKDDGWERTVFAFPVTSGKIYLAYEPLMGSGKTLIKRFAVYCLAPRE